MIFYNKKLYTGSHQKNRKISVIEEIQNGYLAFTFDESNRRWDIMAKVKFSLTILSNYLSYPNVPVCVFYQIF